MTKKLFLCTSPIVYEDDPPGTPHRKVGKDPHRFIHRIVAAENDFKAICLMEEHVRRHELVMDDERIDLTEANEAIGL